MSWGGFCVLGALQANPGFRPFFQPFPKLNILLAFNVKSVIYTGKNGPMKTKGLEPAVAAKVIDKSIEKGIKSRQQLNRIC